MGVGSGARRLLSLLQRSIVLGGVATVLGCPQATSSQPVQPGQRSMSTAEDAAVVLATATSASVTAEVCSFQPEWERPSEDDQAKYIAADPRFAAALDTEPLKTAADSFWQHDVLSFTTYGLSARMEPMLLSGLWSTADQVWESCYGGDQATAINAGELAETWLVDYRLVAVEWEQDRYVMTVEPAASGLQVVHFNRVEAATPLPLQIVDVTGDEVAFVSGDYE